MTLPSMSRTAVSDGTFGDTLLEGFYVVRAPEGGLFVDVLTRESFAYQVLELSDPARLVVDFKPTGSPLETRPPAVGGDTVVLEPRAGTRIGSPSPSAVAPATSRRRTPSSLRTPKGRPWCAVPS